MFLWYRNAAKCYVYLSDVSCKPSTDHREFDQKYKDDFRNSRWLTRGWTLQELLAPKSVEFFSKEGRKLGDKASLELLVYEATGIPIAALRGKSMSSFSISDRLSWQARRKQLVQKI